MKNLVCFPAIFCLLCFLTPPRFIQLSDIELEVDDRILPQVQALTVGPDPGPEVVPNLVEKKLSLNNNPPTNIPVPTAKPPPPPVSPKVCRRNRF